VKEDDALFGPVALGGGFEHVNEAHQRDVEAEDGVLSPVDLVLEEVVADQLLLVVDVLFGAVADDHVVDALERVTSDLGPRANDLQVVFERPFPREVAVQREILERSNLLHHAVRARLRHLFVLSRGCPGQLSGYQVETTRLQCSTRAHVNRVLLVLLGGGIGSVARYLVTLAAVRLLSPDFPFGTLVVNLTGCFFIGFVHTFATMTVRLSPDARLFLTTGVMGGLTTYSSFNYETLAMLDQGRTAPAIVYFSAMVLGCAIAGILGLASARAVVAWG
jgi:CrcB protein